MKRLVERDSVLERVRFIAALSASCAVSQPPAFTTPSIGESAAPTKPRYNISAQRSSRKSHGVEGVVAHLLSLDLE